MSYVDNLIWLERELRRVGQNLTYVLPPLWNLSAVFNIVEHRWLFLTFKKEHHELPRYIKLPFSHKLQGWIGQRMHA